MSGRQHRGTSRKPRPPADQVMLTAARLRAGATGANGVFHDGRTLADEVDLLRTELKVLREAARAVLIADLEGGQTMALGDLALVLDGEVSS